MMWYSRLHIHENEALRSCYSEVKGFEQSLLPAYRASAYQVKFLEFQHIGGQVVFEKSIFSE